MKSFDCGRYVMWGFIAGVIAWTIFIAALVYAAFYVPDVPASPGSMFTRRGGVQAGGFITGWWLGISGLALCGIGYVRAYKGWKCLMGVVPAALYVANPWSVMVFVKFTGG